MTDPTNTELHDAVRRMKIWANQHPWADTQGIVDDEWEGLAMAALGHDWMAADAAKED